MSSFNAKNFRVRIEMLPEWDDDMEKLYVIELRHATVHWDVSKDQWSTLTIQGAPGAYGLGLDLSGHEAD